MHKPWGSQKYKFDNPLKVNALGTKPLKTKTNNALIELFEFPTEPSFNLQGSFIMLQRKRIDGFIYADSIFDPLLKERKIQDIRRQSFKVFSVTGVVALGQRGNRADKMLQEGVRLLKKKGLYRHYMSALDNQYSDWQPYKNEHNNAKVTLIQD